MAQTKKKRSTKHRGNAAGVVETRGRTGRKPTDAEKKPAAASGKRQDRFDRPPTWRGAANRSLIAVVIFVAILVLFFKQTVPASLSLGAVMLLFYIPLSYVTDNALYKRRQRQKQQPKPKKGDAA
jgi:Flp pilus assembly protein TadB